MAKVQRKCKSCKRFMTKMGALSYFMNPVCDHCLYVEYMRARAVMNGE